MSKAFHEIQYNIIRIDQIFLVQNLNEENDEANKERKKLRTQISKGHSILFFIEIRKI